MRARRASRAVPFQVYRFPTSKRGAMDAALSDDILSRQSLVVRDSRHFGTPGDWIYLFVEGTEAGILRADAVLLDAAVGGERAPDASVLHQLLKDEEDAAASGLGSIFG
jgi:hypothetical protein